MQAKEELIDVLSRAITHLLAERNTACHWRDIRSTGLALWALNDCLISSRILPKRLPSLAKEVCLATKWLSNQARQEDVGFSWESEAWDTSLAILALSFDDQHKDRIDQATNWLRDINDPNTGVWYDEVWETTLATVARIRSERIRRGPLPQQRWSWIDNVLNWLTSIPSKSSGEFICPHYSGFLLWLLGELRATRGISTLMSSETFQPELCTQPASRTPAALG
jgi:hypothetical protein